MLTTYIWTSGIIILLLTFIVGFYVEWSATISFVSVINELYHLTKVIWNARSEGIGLPISLDYNGIWKFLATSCFCISIGVLMDRVPTSWRQLTVGNRIHTSHYNNVASLVFNETLGYLLSIPNLITLTIGLLQAYSTTTLVKVEYPFLLNISGLGLLYLGDDKSPRKHYWYYLLYIKAGGCWYGNT